MKIVAPEKWNPGDGIDLEENALKAVKSEHNVLVIAGPGAGKTELLAQKASYLFQTSICRDPQKILALSFKYDAADTLKQRVMKRCGKEIETRFISMTYDAFSKSILDHFRFALPEYLRPDPNYQICVGKELDIIVDAAFKKSGYENKKNLKGKNLKNDYKNIIKSVIFPFSQNNLGEKVWRLLINGFDEYQPTLSFEMISILAEFIISTNSKIKKGLQLTYKYVFLDEFQDTTDLQYKLIKQCFCNSKSILTAVGDNKQRIMGWAGALETVFDDFILEFNSKIQRLVMNYRSAPRLIDLQKKMYASLNETNCTADHSEKWNLDDGKVLLIKAKNEDCEAKEISKHIFEQISSGIDPNKLCILCRQMPENYTSKIISELSNYQIPARIENAYQDLIKEPIVELLTRWLYLAVERKRPQDWDYIVTVATELWNINSWQSDDDYLRMQINLNEGIKQLSNRIKNVKSQESFQELIGNIIEFWGSDHIIASYQRYSQGTYLNGLLNKFQNYMWMELKKTQMDWKLAIENFQGLHSVPIMTVHKSKGLEYETVYFIGLEDSAFWKFKENPEEERCAFFVALSRAKREIVFTFCKHRCVSWDPEQHHNDINEFFELLETPGVATIKEC